MADNQQHEIMGFLRGIAFNAIKDLNEGQLLAVPKGFNNSVLWNIGHVYLYDCMFLYAPSGQELPCPEGYEAFFKGGTSPADWNGKTPDVQEVLERCKEMPAKLASDHKEGKFNGFKELELTPQLTLTSFDSALTFQTMHTGVHLGRINALRKFL